MIDDPIRVSVVIPTYNQSQFLACAIESVLANTMQPVDIVVVDDGGDDRAAVEVCARYARVRFMRQENQGVSATRNSGMRTSTGDWILFLDADDWLKEDAIANLASAVRSSPHVGLVIGRSERQSTDGLSKCQQSRLVDGSAGSYCGLLAADILWHPAQVLFRKNVLEENGGWKLRVGAEDLELLLRIASRNSYVAIPNVVSVYFQHAGNASSDPWRMYRSIALCFRAHEEDARLSPAGRGEFIQARKARLDFYARGILLSGYSRLKDTGRPWKLIKALSFVAVRRPTQIGWFFKLSLQRLGGRRPVHPQPR